MPAIKENKQLLNRHEALFSMKTSVWPEVHADHSRQNSREAFINAPPQIQRPHVGMRVFAFVCQLQRQKECVSPDCGRSCCSEWYLHRLENQRLINLPMIHGRWGVPVFSSLHGLINVNGLIISAETDIRQDIMKNTSCYKVTRLLFLHHDLGRFKTNNIKNWSLREGLEQSEPLIESRATGR